MTATIIELCLELCRMIMVRQGELWESKTRSLPTHFYFEGFDPANISYNIRELHKAKLITATTPENWTKGQLSIWPTGLEKNGWLFLEAAKDEDAWTEAVETVTAQGNAHNLKALKAALFAGEREEALWSVRTRWVINVKGVKKLRSFCFIVNIS